MHFKSFQISSALVLDKRTTAIISRNRSLLERKIQIKYQKVTNVISTARWGVGINEKSTGFFRRGLVIKSEPRSPGVS